MIFSDAVVWLLLIIARAIGTLAALVVGGGMLIAAIVAILRLWGWF